MFNVRPVITSFCGRQLNVGSFFLRRTINARKIRAERIEIHGERTVQSGINNTAKLIHSILKLLKNELATKCNHLKISKLGMSLQI